MLKSILRTAAVAASFSMVSLSAGVSPVQAETLPTANEMFAKMGFGINIGNTMEVPGNPTGWGNKFPTEAYIDSIKAAGFSTVRIPCAWYSHSNAMSRDSSTTDIVPGGGPNEIAASWMDSVQTVVDMCMRAGLVTILNIHWDNGWLEGKLNDTDKDAVNARQKDFWTQIASHFKNYNENLLFASANEPATTDANYKHETEILMTYHQTFVDAVRATGGNNGSRTLIIQGPSTSIDRTSEVMPVDKLPKDVSLLVTFEMFENHVKRNGLVSPVADYALAFPGPGKKALPWPKASTSMPPMATTNSRRIASPSWSPRSKNTTRISSTVPSISPKTAAKAPCFIPSAAPARSTIPPGPSPRF